MLKIIILAFAIIVIIGILLIRRKKWFGLTTLQLWKFAGKQSKQGKELKEAFEILKHRERITKMKQRNNKK